MCCPPNKKNLTQRRKERKEKNVEEVSFFLFSFALFAPLREVLLQ